MRKIIKLAILAVLVLFLLWLAWQKPSHNRNWEMGQEKLPQITIENTTIVVNNFRDFDWYDEFKAHSFYRQEKFDLDNIEGVDVVISHFDEFEGMAHIFLIFRFSDGKNMAVSVESRREVGEKFSPFLGLVRQFEIMYVVGSERDLVGVRTGPRKERVYLYPTVATPEKAKELFSLIAKDINAINKKPVFYNTLLNNCTNVITRRVEDISEAKFPLTYKTILPGYMDEVVYEIGLIPTDAPFEDVKKRYWIDNELVDKNNKEYSSQIRQGIKN